MRAAVMPLGYPGRASTRTNIEMIVGPVPVIRTPDGHGRQRRRAGDGTGCAAVLLASVVTRAADLRDVSVGGMALLGIRGLPSRRRIRSGSGQASSPAVRWGETRETLCRGGSLMAAWSGHRPRAADRCNAGCRRAEPPHLVTSAPAWT